MLWWRLVLCCALAGLPAVGVLAAGPLPRSYEVPPGPLATALSQLAEQAGVVFAADARLTQGKASPGVSGHLDLPDAFARVLDGSGLELTQEDGIYGLKPVREVGGSLAPLPLVVARAPQAAEGYAAARTRSATRTDTPLQELPQSITVLTRQQIDDLGVQSVAELLRWVPGVGAAQGEGNRDTPVFRGSASTSDFLFDGMRDDVQYYRDLYNVERVEVLRGPNAMLMGYGGVSGLINRVGKTPGWQPQREFALQVGAWDNRRATLDWNQPLGEAWAGRLNAMLEDSQGYRDGVQLRRFGVNPTARVRLDGHAQLTLGLEYFEDERTADRGIPSSRGRRLPVDIATFFGNPDDSVSRLRMRAAYAYYERDLGDGWQLSNRTRFADHDKFFQNVFPGTVRPTGAPTEVALSAHNSQTTRRNAFNQTSLAMPVRQGRWQHLLLAGLDLGRQDSSNARETGYFGNGGTVLYVPVDAPTWRAPLRFRRAASDPDADARTDSVAAYLQDQLRWSPHWLAVLGLRFEDIETRVNDRRAGRQLASRNQVWSPRAGLIYQPDETLSFYANYGVGYLPRSGEQFTALTPANQTLQPEQYETREVGAKWLPRPQLSLTAALFETRRTRVAVAVPNVPDTLALVDGQRTRGLELGISGPLAARWQVSGGYAYQEGRVLSSLSPTARAGATLPHVPRHSVSLWNRWTLDERWAAGLGVSGQSGVFASTDNTVRLPGYGRVDAALFFQPAPRLHLQLNVENLLDRRYDAFAHNNNNITPGAPLAWRLVLRGEF